MASPLQSLIDCGTTLWLDSIDPDLVAENFSLGITGATSNPIIIADLIKTGRYDGDLQSLIEQGLDDDSIAWKLTDQLVREAQGVFLPVWKATNGNDGYVSFELDPLLEDPVESLSHDERVECYIELGRSWSADQSNRMIKVPATPAGIDALEELTAAGVALNVTLIFTSDQYRAARDAIWRGAQQLSNLSRFKSVYSIFVSRIDVYTQADVAQLSPAAQGQVGIVNAKRIWQENREFWSSQSVPLGQEIVFASTGAKNPDDPPWKYVESLAGSDIQTNPPAINQAVIESDLVFQKQVDQFPGSTVLDEIDLEVDFQRLERVLMDEGIEKFAAPQKALLALIADKRSAISAT